MNTEWTMLYERAKEATNPYEVSKNVYIGSVGAAILTEKGSVYTGICIDTSCSLGICAEKNALSTMLSNGEYVIKKICAVHANGTVMSPCGSCREFMMQLGEQSKQIEVLLDTNGRSVKLEKLMPEYPY